MKISDRQIHFSYPLLSRMSPFTQMRRTLQAFDVETKVFVFVKDYWRVVTTGMVKEGDIYSLLKRQQSPEYRAIRQRQQRAVPSLVEANYRPCT